MSKNYRIEESEGHYHFGAFFFAPYARDCSDINPSAIRHFETKISLMPHGFVICADGRITVSDVPQAKEDRKFYFCVDFSCKITRRSFNLFERMMKEDLSQTQQKRFKIKIVYFAYEKGTLNPEILVDTLVLYDGQPYLKKSLDAWQDMLKTFYPAYWLKKTRKNK